MKYLPIFKSKWKGVKKNSVLLRSNHSPALDEMEKISISPFSGQQDIFWDETIKA